jgi:hypothetical protein
VSKRRRRFARHRRTTVRTPARAAGRRMGREKARGISNKRASPGGRRLGGTTTGRMGTRDDKGRLSRARVNRKCSHPRVDGRSYAPPSPLARIVSTSVSMP